jgi:hypothetical protein
VRFKLAILNVLAKHPDGRATLDEVRRAVGTLMTSGGQTEQLKRFSALGDIDIFQSGLVLRDDVGLQITDAGLSLLHSLESSSGPPLNPASALASPPLGLTDDLIERLRTFDLELTAPGNNAHEGVYDHQSVEGEETRTAPTEAAYGTSRVSPVDLHESTNSRASERGQKLVNLDRLRAFFAAKKQSILEIGRRYLARQASAASNGRSERLTRNMGGAAFALLSVVLVIACVIIAIAFGQIQSLKSDIAALRRELLPAKERITRLELIEKAKRDLAQDEEAQKKSDTDKSKAGGEVRTDQTTLNLSREEIQLIKDYIKPAPSVGPAAPAINVGDPVGGAMIPLPSPLTEKIPKLLGARFTTRNGAIIIIKRDSHQADAVLPSK